jgi:hypothetical protein
VPRIMSSRAWRDHGLLLITWDEGEDSGNHVLTLAVEPGDVHRESEVAYNHYSLLATIEDRLGVGRLAAAASATPMTDIAPRD